MVVPTDIPASIVLSGENPGGRWGPGIALHAQSGLTDFSNFTAPFWKIFGSLPGPLPAPTINVWQFAWTTPSQQLVLDVGKDTPQLPYTLAVPTDTSVPLTAQLFANPGLQVESGTGQVTWDAQSGIPAVIKAQAVSGGGGLTDAQAEQLSEVHQATFTDQLLDNLTLAELGGPGPSGGPLNGFIRNWVWGILVRIANVPEDLLPNTPDGDYWFPSLAVCRIFRGSDLWLRVPIHTSSKIIGFGAEGIVAAVTALTETQWLLDMSVQVTFRTGVTGQAFLMALP